VKSSLSGLTGRHFALVGRRRATIYGKRNAYWMAQELSKAGLQICSGLASGIDSRAHEGALDSGKKTIAVIGTGIDSVYPSGNKKLAQRIVGNEPSCLNFQWALLPILVTFLDEIGLLVG